MYLSWIYACGALILVLGVCSPGHVIHSNSLNPNDALMEADEQNTLTDKWKYLRLARYWPQSVCLQARTYVPPIPCTVPVFVYDFTIHGLWPSAESSPEFCNSSWPFNASTIESLVPLMTKLWPQLWNSYLLWAHEWSKHGTCALDLPTLHGEHNFFAHALGLHLKYNITRYFSASNITPSETRMYSNPRYQLLFQVILCFDKRLQLIDCGPVTYFICDPEQPVQIPPIQHSACDF